jgi:hypothetical protein
LALRWWPLASAKRAMHRLGVSLHASAGLELGWMR